MRQFPSRLRRLDDALADLPVDEPMLLTELDGYLTGVLLCPDPITPDEWLPVIWGGEIGSAPFDDPADAQWFRDAVTARHDEIARDLARGKPKPIFDVDERNGEVLWEFWAGGFAEAMDLRAAEWAALAEREPDLAATLSRLSILIAVAHQESELDSVELDAVHDEAPTDISDLVVHLQARRVRSSAAQSSTTSPIDAHFTRPGRNDPCPCGSGKKFKRCCA